MKESKRRKSVFFVVSVFVLFCYVGSSWAVTSKEVDKAIQKASKLSRSSDQHQEKLLSLEKKLEEATKEDAQARKKLEEISASGKATQIDIQQAEIALKRTNQKVLKLTNKLESHRPETERVKMEADEAVQMAKKLANQIEYETATETLKKAEDLLESYTSKVSELEGKEREAQAEALAREKIAYRSKSPWDRWLNNWNEKLARTKSDSLLDEITSYREKIKRVEKDIEIAKSRLREAEKDKLSYRHSQP